MKKKQKENLTHLSSEALPISTHCVICYIEEKEFSIGQFIFKGNSLCEKHFNNAFLIDFGKIKQ